MAIASITAWLNSKTRDFHHGCMLYKQYGSDKLILTIINTGSGNYHFNKLVEGMEALNKLSNIQPKQIDFKEPEPLSNKDDQWKDVPDAILEIRNEKNKIYAQARKRFEAIRFLDSSEHRLEAALIMLNEMDAVRDSWAIIDEFRETGNIREIKKQKAVEDVADLDLKELLRQRGNIESYISKDKGRIAKATDPKLILKYKVRLEERELKLAEIKRRIDELI